MSPADSLLSLRTHGESMRWRSCDTNLDAGRDEPGAKVLIDVTRKPLSDINDSRFLTIVTQMICSADRDHGSFVLYSTSRSVAEGCVLDPVETFPERRYLRELGVFASALRSRSGGVGLIRSRASFFQRQVPERH